MGFAKLKSLVCKVNLTGRYISVKDLTMMTIDLFVPSERVTKLLIIQLWQYQAYLLRMLSLVLRTTGKLASKSYKVTIVKQAEFNLIDLLIYV